LHNSYVYIFPNRDDNDNSNRNQNAFDRAHKDTGGYGNSDQHRTSRRHKYADYGCESNANQDWDDGFNPNSHIDQYSSTNEYIRPDCNPESNVDSGL
jgi:hypothetical protein